MTTVTNSSIATSNLKKNSDLFDKKQGGKLAQASDNFAKGSKGVSMTPNNRVGSANF